VFLTLDGISEEMDDDASASLENVTQTFLGEQYTDSMEVSEVTVLSQSLVEEEGGERKLRHGSLGRNLLQKSLRSLETSTSSSLYIELVVDGTVLDWQALESFVESPKDGTNRGIGDNSIKDSIATAIESSLSTNNDDFKTRLAESSDFFPFESSRSILEPTAAVKPGGEGGTSSNQLIFIIVGVAVALVVLVGSMFYMERKSGAKRRRALEPHDIDDEMEHAYDLNDLEGDLEGEDDAHMINEENIEEHNVHSPTRLASARVQDALSRSSRSRVSGKKMGKVNEARMTSLMDNMDSGESDEKHEISALDMSPEALKAAIKKKDNNIFVFTKGHKRSSSGTSYKRSSSGNNSLNVGNNDNDNGDGGMLDQKPSDVSSLSNPSQIEELTSPSPRVGYLGEHFNYTNVEKMIGDQYDTRAIMTPFAPKGNSGNATPSRRTNYSFSSPVNSVTRTRSSRKDKLFDVYAPPGPLGIIIDTTPEGPMIHSLKPTSQLLGLVNPGDLIVGLDGVDTRNMTAATFTRLMAKRSQGERKITLLKGLAPLTPIAATSTPR